MNISKPEIIVDCPYIVADVGGTNSRFALVTTVNRESNEFVLENKQTYPSSDFTSIDEAVLCYKESLDGLKVSNACLSVAGPVASDKFKLTNLNWNINIDESKKRLGLSKLLFINDFAAYAYAIQYIKACHFRSIRKGKALDEHPIAVIGPGTGFGTAMLIESNGKKNAIALEGGHMSLATNTALQSAIKEYMSRRFERVTIEKIFSGPGLRYLYQALAAVEGATARKISTAEISDAALAASDDMCVRTLSLFCSWFGSVTGDLALALGARGGIYLGGGILPRIADFLLASDFDKSFMSKGDMSHYLKEIPIQLVTEGNSALLGAAGWFDDYGVVNQSKVCEHQEI